jgi:hypothetical protein
MSRFAGSLLNLPFDSASTTGSTAGAGFVETQGSGTNGVGTGTGATAAGAGVSATTPQIRGVAPQSAGSIAETASGGALVNKTNIFVDPDAVQDSVSFERPPSQPQSGLFPLPLVTGLQLPRSSDFNRFPTGDFVSLPLTTVPVRVPVPVPVPGLQVPGTAFGGGSGGGGYTEFLTQFPGS